MKTKVLAVTRLPSAYREHLKLLSSLEQAQVASAARWFAKMSTSVERELDDDELLELAKVTGLPWDKAQPLLACLDYSTRLLQRYDDDAGEFVADLVGMGELPAESAPKLAAGLAELQLPEGSIKAGRGLAETALATYQRAATRCLVIAKYEHEYSVDDDPDDYEARVSDLLPAIVLTIETDGPAKEAGFSVTLLQKDAERLVRRLRMALTQLDALTTRVHG